LKWVSGGVSPFGISKILSIYLTPKCLKSLCVSRSELSRFLLVQSYSFGNIFLSKVSLHFSLWFQWASCTKNLWQLLFRYNIHICLASLLPCYYASFFSLTLFISLFLLCLSGISHYTFHVFPWTVLSS
jgi:hypothetical protein